MGMISNFLSLLPSLWLSFSFIILIFMSNFSFVIALTTTVSTTARYDAEIKRNHSSFVSSPSNLPTPLAPPPQEPLFKSKGSLFRPSIAVIVGVLATVFSITFLLLLYAKHCRRSDNNPFSGNSRGYPPTTARKNSGIDRAMIESLPIFRFASLRGKKDGLECAVCLNKFEPTEVLRLLPKCKHAFHVECVDTWLDAHSTCPLCRYRVDPEDILLVEDNKIVCQSDIPLKSPSKNHATPDLGSISRVSGRHSFAGNSLEVIAETPKADATSFVARRSLDSWNSRKKKNSEIVAVGCFDSPRKDELLLADKTSTSVDTSADQRRLEHRIIISGGTEMETEGTNHRWSDVQPSDLLFLRSEMILSDSRRFSGSRGSRLSTSPRLGEECTNSSSGGGGGRNVIKWRSLSEITGLSRFRSNEHLQQHEHEHEHDQQHQHQHRQRQQRQEEQRKRQAGVVSRWLAWNSQSQNQQQIQTQVAVHRISSSSASASVVV